MQTGMPNLPPFQVRVALLSDAAFSLPLSKRFIKKHPVTKGPEGGFKEPFKASFIILENLIVPGGEALLKLEGNS